MTAGRRWGAAAAIALAVVPLAGCGGDASESADVDVSHVHGLGVVPGEDRVLIATHAGLVSFEDGELARAGDLGTDLMGFTVGEGGRLYASGHPGEGEDGPFALGLISSTDEGGSWEALSLSGEADFHALDAAGSQVVGYDGASGALLRSDDEGASWSSLPLDAPVADLAVFEDGRVVATTEAGLQVSADGGETFDLVQGAPGLLLVDATDDGGLVGVDPDGGVHTSEDLETWQSVDSVGSVPRALTTGPAGEVWVATDEALWRSTDAGATFSEAVGW